MNLGKPIREEKPTPDEWVHEPTPECPHRYRNVNTGFYANRQPTPPPKKTDLPYMGPQPWPFNTNVDIELIYADPFYPPEFWSGF